MSAYGGGLTEKPEIIGLNKADSMSPRETSSRLAALRKASGRPVYLLSGATGRGVPELLRVLQDTIHAARREKAEQEQAA
jgi:GTP-binding protein